MLFHRMAGGAATNAVSRVAGSAATSAISVFFIGAMAAGAVLALIKQQEPRLSGVVRGRPSHDGKSLEELIAEKERLEDLIAEKAAKESGG